MFNRNTLNYLTVYKQMINIRITNVYLEYFNFMQTNEL